VSRSGFLSDGVCVFLASRKEASIDKCDQADHIDGGEQEHRVVFPDRETRERQGEVVQLYVNVQSIYNGTLFFFSILRTLTGAFRATSIPVATGGIEASSKLLLVESSNKQLRKSPPSRRVVLSDSVVQSDS
jgi:hypothetical protein